MISIKKSGAITFFAQLTVFVIGFATTIILARILGPTDRGVYALVILIPTILWVLGTLGIEVANVYYSANRQYDLSHIASNSLIVGIGVGLVMMFLLWGASTTTLFQDFLEDKGIQAIYFWIALIALPFLLLYGFFSKILLGKEEIVKYNSLSIVQYLLQFALIVAMLAVFSNNLLGTVVAYTIATVAVALLAIVMVWKSSWDKVSFNRDLLKNSIRYGGLGYIGNTAQYLSYRLDLFLIAYFLNPTAVGFYSIALGVTERLWLIPSSLSQVLFPRISASSDEQANELTPKVARHTLFIVLVSAILLLILVKPLVWLLFGESFLPSVTPLIILLPGTIALSISKIISSDLSGRGLPSFGAVSSTVALVVNLILNLFMIPRLGIAGAALSSTISYSLATTILIVAFVRVTKTSLADILLLRLTDLRVYMETIPKIKERLVPARIDKG